MLSNNSSSTRPNSHTLTPIPPPRPLRRLLAVHSYTCESHKLGTRFFQWRNAPPAEHASPCSKFIFQIQSQSQFQMKFCNPPKSSQSRTTTLGHWASGHKPSSSTPHTVLRRERSIIQSVMANTCTIGVGVGAPQYTVTASCAITSLAKGFSIFDIFCSRCLVPSWSIKLLNGWHRAMMLLKFSWPA